MKTEKSEVINALAAFIIRVTSDNAAIKSKTTDSEVAALPAVIEQWRILTEAKLTEKELWRIYGFIQARKRMQKKFPRYLKTVPLLIGWSIGIFVGCVLIAVSRLMS